MNQFMTIEEAAAYIGVARPTLYAYTSRKQIPFYKLGRRVAFKQTDLDQWIESRRVESVR